MPSIDTDIKAHARAHVYELTARTTELVGEVIAKGMLGVLEEAISMKLRIAELETELAQRAASKDSERDAARFVFSYDPANVEAMLQIEFKAIQCEPRQPVDWWRAEIDAAIAAQHKQS